MGELKTLKTMSFREDGDLNAKDPAKMYLKDEAIKWIKQEIRIKKEEDDNYRFWADSSLVRWMSRFNITEEELKSEE